MLANSAQRFGWAEAFGTPGKLARVHAQLNCERFLLLLLLLQSPGEIKRREASWTLTKRLDFHLLVQESLRGGRWCWTLKRAQKKKNHEQGGGPGLRKLDSFCLKLLLSTSAADIVLVTLLRTAVETAIPSTACRHLPPNSARFSYATEGVLFISAQLSTDAVSALPKLRVLVRLWKQPSAQART